MEIKRQAYQQLLDWRHAKTRKPLLIRGARQVGKTTLVRAFGQEFSCFVELNLEKKADRRLFENEDIDDLLNAIFLAKGKKSVPNSTLIFIDEIQEAPKAIQQLRYFYEDRPDIFVVAAGSLLEFALVEIPSFPVGRIEYLYLHPVNFLEFLGAINPISADLLTQIPIPAYAHDTLLSLFHKYALIGGMPEIVQQYIETKNIQDLSISYNRLWQSYKDDVEKYAENNTEKLVIRHVIDTAPFEMDRIKFEGFGQSNYRSREVGEALRALDLARIIQLIYPSNAVRPPIMPNLRQRPRLQFIDTGLLNNILLLQKEMILLSDLDGFHRGKILQHLVAQELISIHERNYFKPNFWVKEESNRNAEVDLVYQSAQYIIPIEVKSGAKGRLRSLHQYMDRTNHPYALRIHGGKFLVEKLKTPNGTPFFLMNLPYYLGTQIPTYLDWFIKEFTL